MGSSKRLKCTSKCTPNGLRGSVALVLRTHRTARQVPLKHAAAELGVSVSTLSAWELGERFPSAENLENLATYYNLPACCLLNGACHGPA